jgi:Protein of unknown function (DUF2844)
MLKAGGSIFKSGAPRRGVTLAGSVLGILLTAFPAWGALGGDTVSILADQSAMQGSRRTTATKTYTLHEIQAANGTVVREYQSTDGNVFAVTWHGQFRPDMRQVLGSYFDQYAQAMQARSSSTRRERGPVTIQQPGLTVQLGGHMRALVGRAYVPEKLPQGMRAEDIQ